MTELFKHTRLSPATFSVHLLVILTLFAIFTFIESTAKEYYKWEDDKGTIHITDDKDRIPGEHIETTEIYKEDGGQRLSGSPEYYLNYIIHRWVTITLAAAVLLLSVLCYIFLYITADRIRLYIFRYSTSRNEKLLNESGVADMNLTEIVEYIKSYYKKKGYEISSEGEYPGSIDFIATKGKDSIGVNVNNNINPVSVIYLNGINSERARLGIKSSAIFTTGTFEDDTYLHSGSAGCYLYDKYAVAKIVKNFSESRNQNPKNYQ